MTLLKSTKLLIAAVVLVTAGCTEIQYREYGQSPPDGNTFTRIVEAKVEDAYYTDPPQCIVVLPFEIEGKAPKAGIVVEQSLARGLSFKVARVMGPFERDHNIQGLALDMKENESRRLFAKSTGCGFYLQAKPWGGDDVYAVVWNQTRIGMDVEIARFKDDHVIWRARHVAERSDGGLPFSPLSVVTNAFSAARMQNDSDVRPSLIDDAVRRIFHVLPDARYAMMQQGVAPKNKKSKDE